MKGLAAFFRETGGTTVVELALIMPVLVMFIFGIWAVGWALYDGGEVRHAVELGSRIYISNPSASLATLTTAVSGNLLDIPINAVTLQSTSLAVGSASVQHITWSYQTSMTIPFMSALPMSFGGAIDVPMATP